MATVKRVAIYATFLLAAAPAATSSGVSTCQPTEVVHLRQGDSAETTTTTWVDIETGEECVPADIEARSWKIEPRKGSSGHGSGGGSSSHGSGGSSGHSSGGSNSHGKDNDEEEEEEEDDDDATTTSSTMVSTSTRVSASSTAKADKQKSDDDKKDKSAASILAPFLGSTAGISLLVAAALFA